MLANPTTQQQIKMNPGPKGRKKTTTTATRERQNEIRDIIKGPSTDNRFVDDGACNSGTAALSGLPVSVWPSRWVDEIQEGVENWGKEKVK